MPSKKRYDSGQRNGRDSLTRSNAIPLALILDTAGQHAVCDPAIAELRPHGLRPFTQKKSWSCKRMRGIWGKVDIYAS